MTGNSIILTNQTCVLLTHQRSFLLQQMRTNIQTTQARHYTPSHTHSHAHTKRERKRLEHPTLHDLSPSNFSPQNSGNPIEERGERVKESEETEKTGEQGLLHQLKTAHINSQRLKLAQGFQGSTPVCDYAKDFILMFLSDF